MAHLTSGQRTQRTRRPTSPTPATRREETARRTRDRLLPPEDRPMTDTPAAAGSATNHNDPDRADLAQHDPSYNPTTRDCATCYGTTRRDRAHQRGRRPPAQHAQRTPKEWRLALAAHGVGHKYDPSDLFPHPPDEGHTSWTSATRLQPGKGAAPHPEPPSHLTLLSHVKGPRGAGQRGQPNTRSSRANR